MRSSLALAHRHHATLSYLLLALGCGGWGGVGMIVVDDDEDDVDDGEDDDYCHYCYDFWNYSRIHVGVAS